MQNNNNRKKQMELTGKLIRYFRTRTGLSQKDLASALGKDSYMTIVNWETGKTTPRDTTLLEMAKLFNIDENLLVKGFPITIPILKIEDSIEQKQYKEEELMLGVVTPTGCLYTFATYSSARKSTEDMSKFFKHNIDYLSIEDLHFGGLLTEDNLLLDVLQMNNVSFDLYVNKDNITPTDKLRFLSDIHTFYIRNDIPDKVIFDCIYNDNRATLPVKRIREILNEFSSIGTEFANPILLFSFYLNKEIQLQHANLLSLTGLTNNDMQFPITGLAKYAYAIWKTLNDTYKRHSFLESNELKQLTPKMILAYLEYRLNRYMELPKAYIHYNVTKDYSTILKNSGIPKRINVEINQEKTEIAKNAIIKDELQENTEAAHFIKEFIKTDNEILIKQNEDLFKVRLESQLNKINPEPFKFEEYKDNLKLLLTQKYFNKDNTLVENDSKFILRLLNFILLFESTNNIERLNIYIDIIENLQSTSDIQLGKIYSNIMNILKGHC